MPYRKTNIMRGFSLLAAIITITLAQIASAQEPRSFKNGFATRISGNVYQVESYEDDGKGERLDKSVDGSNGPAKGDVIGLTESERERKVPKIICPECSY
jgi:radical SAM superfamily enzyme YgiQ (UPF0313 family)